MSGSTAVSTAHKRAAFRKLHDSGCFVLPNPWDVGGARLLQSIGFSALASTSSGYAWSTGRPDNAVGVDDVIAHLAMVCGAVNLPVNADFESGFARDSAAVAANVTRVLATGIAGLSIEDASGDAASPIFTRDRAIERIQAARSAIDAECADVMLVGRCEAFLFGSTDLTFVIDRLQAYAEAGSDCLYAPGIKSKEHIATIVKELSPKPVNVLVGAPGFTVAELADIGVRRISVGGALARASWAAFINASREIAGKGSFASFGSAMPFAELNGMFGK